MARTKGESNIQQINPAVVTVDGEDMEVAAHAVESVTTDVPHEADASSAPGPYTDLDVNRPPVSTNRPNVPIAHSLVAGAGAPTPQPDYRPEDPPNPKDNPSAYVSAEDKKAGNVVEMEADDAGNVTVKEDK